MSVARILGTVVTAAAVLAASMSPAAAQQAPDTETEPEPEAAEPTPAGSGPVLGAGFVLEGVWLAPGVASLGWDDVDAAAGYELMYRGPDGWRLLSEREPSGGVRVTFENSSAVVAGLPLDEAEWWFAVRARNVFGVSEWSHSAAVRAPEEAAAVPLFDPFTAPTRSGIDLERLREAVATVTPGVADCAAAPTLDVEGVTVVDPPADLDDPDAVLTVAEVVRVAGGCMIVEYVALAGRTVAQVRELLAADASVHAVSEPVRGIVLDDNTGAHTHTGDHHNDSGRAGGEQWHLPQPTMRTLWNGWNDATDRQVVVAVIDTGVDTTHPDLDDNVAADSSGGCHAQDNNGHGTQMAGIIAAELGGGHVAGVAPEARILPLRFSHSDSGACGETLARLVPLTATEAVARAVNEGARVINMSFRWLDREQESTEVGGVPVEPGKAGRDSFGLALRAASMLGVVAVTSSGNCGQGGPDCSEHNAEKRPAVYDDVITVAGIRSDGHRVASSTANVNVDVAAPGDGILTTQRFDTTPRPDRTEWQCFSTHCVEPSGGTSAAAAYVSGVVAHLLNRYPQASVGQVRAALEQSAIRPPPPLRHPDNPAIILKRTPRGRDGDDAIVLEPYQDAPTEEYGRGIVDPAAAITELSGLVEALEPVGAGGAFVSLSAGARHTCGLRSGNGAVLCWGLAAVVDETPDVAFASLSSSPGGDFVCGVRRVDHAVMCWGDVPSAVTTDVAGARVLDTDGATAPDGRFEQVAVGNSHVCGLRPGGRVVCWGDDTHGQTEVPFGLFGASPSQRANRIVAGADHTCAVTEATGSAASTVVCWGKDTDAQLPLAVPFAVRDVAAGAAHTCVLGQDRLVRCYGRDADGRTDAPSGEYAALWAGTDHTCAVSSSGGPGLSCWGDNTHRQTTAPLAGDYVQVAAGSRHNCARNVSVRVVCWGDNTHGQAPQQARLNSLSLTAGGTDLLAGHFSPDVTDYTVTASEASATLRAAVNAGDATRSRICTDSNRYRSCEAVSRTVPVSLADGDTIEVTVRALFGYGASRTYRIHVSDPPRLAALSVRRLASGVDCPGEGCPPYVLVPGFDAAVTEYSVVVPPAVDEVTVAYSAADVADSVSVLPLDASGGADGSPGHQVALTTNTGFVSVDAGNRHSCGLTAGGVARCWGGYDFSGEARVPSGTYLLVSAGWAHTCAIETDNSVACWGDNYWGQSRAPSGSFASVWAGGGHSCALTTSGTVRCWGYDYSGQSSPPSGTFTAVAAGSNHSCGITAAGTLRCWGLNIRGEASPPSGTFTALSTSWRHTCAIATDSTVSCWGASGSGRTTAPSGTFISVSAGDEHSCGVKTDNTAVCWGNNGSGRATAPAGSFTAVSAGDEHSCGLTTAGAVLCWGAAIAAAQPAEPAAVTVSVTSGTDATVTTSYTVTIKRTDTQQAGGASGAASTSNASDRSLIDETLAGSPATGRSANTAQCTSPATTPVPPESPITVSDPALRAALEQALNKPAGETITAAEMATLTTLSVPRTAAAPGAVTDLTGLQHATALEALDVAGHDIASLAPLTCLTSLKALNVARNQITDLAALRGLTSLQRLYLYDNQISDISALSKLTSLTSLYLDHNSITDISALSGLTSLSTLGLGDNDITSVSALSTLTGLETLYVFDNDIADANSLSGLSGLVTLWVDGNDLTNPYQLTLGTLGYLDARHNLISDIAPLDSPGATVHSEPQRVATVRITDAGLRALLLAVLNKGPRQPINPAEIATIARLERLGRQGDPAPVGDLAGLEHATGLRELRLRRNTFTSIQPITQLEGLTHLDLQSNQLSGLGSLRGLKSLQWLNLIDNNLTTIEDLPPLIHTLFADSNQITDISSLAALDRLAVLSLKANNITDLEPLSGLSELHWIILTDNNITDLTPVAGLTRIYYLRLNHNNIEDLEPLQALTRITNLHLQGNNITDLEPLRGLTRLRVLDLRDNHITSLEPLRGLTSLQDLFIDGNHITDFTPLNNIAGLTIHGRNNQTPPS